MRRAGSDLDLSVAWYREALGLTHESAAGVPGAVAFMVAPSGERFELLAVDVQPSAWDDPIAALRAGVPHTAWTVDDLDVAHARAVEAGDRSVWTPRDTPEPGLFAGRTLLRPTDEIGAAVQSNRTTTRSPREGSCDHETDHHDASHRRWGDAGKRRRVG